LVCHGLNAIKITQINLGITLGTIMASEAISINNWLNISSISWSQACAVTSSRIVIIISGSKKNGCAENKREKNFVEHHSWY
jgi:hypothetical protein